MTPARWLPCAVLALSLAPAAVADDVTAGGGCAAPVGSTVGLVTIEAERPLCTPRPCRPPLIDAPRWLPRTVVDSGAGVVAAPDGLVLTAASLVDQAERITVVADGRRLEASLVEAEAGLALLRVDAALAPATLGEVPAPGAVVALGACGAARLTASGELLLGWAGPGAGPLPPGTPLLADGRVVGLNAFVLRLPALGLVGPGPRLLCATPVDRARPLIDRHGSSLDLGARLGPWLLPWELPADLRARPASR